MKTVFSIHNIEYQGYYGLSAFDDFLGIPPESGHVLVFNDGVNLMKGGIECADMVSTVSPTYARELEDPFFSFGMEEIIKRNSHKMRGVLNGINTNLYDPGKDPDIAENYTSENPEGKKACKTALQEELALGKSDAMLITMVSRLVPAKGMDLLRAVMDSILERYNVQFVMLGTGDGEYEDFFRGLEERHRDNARCLIKFDAAMSHRIYAAGDLLLVPSRSEPCGLTQMIGCRYGDIPLVRQTGGLADSIKDCTLGEGNGFVFDNYDIDSLYGAIVNAIERYQDRDNWEKLVKHDLSLDFGWAASASEYRDMYESITE